MWAYVYIWENWLFKLCSEENSFQYKNICSWITGALMHKKVRPNNSFRNSKPFKKKSFSDFFTYEEKTTAITRL